MSEGAGFAAAVSMNANKARLAFAAMVVAALAFATPAVAQDYMYWSQNASVSSSSAIARANIDGTGINPSFVAAGSTVGNIAFDSTHMYWSGPSGVSRANIDGTGTTVIYTGLVAPGIAIDSQYFYAFVPSGGGGNIIRGNLDGTGVNATFLPISGDAFYLTADASHIYWADGINNKIGRANIDGTGADPNFITVSTGVQALAVNGSHIFWALESPTNAIGRANLDGSGVNNSFMTGLTAPQAVAVDRNYIYWSEGSAPRNIGRANLDGTSPNSSFVVTGATSPVYGLAVGPAGIARYDLSVTRSGTGGGTVTSSPAGIDCGSTCTATYDAGTSVTLTAAAAAGSEFIGWGGACAGNGSTCTVPMSQAQSVTAAFNVSNRFTVRTPYLVGTGVRTLVAVPGPGVIRQVGTFRSKGKVRQACSSGAVMVSAAGVNRLRCRLSDAVRAARKKGTVRMLLTTTYTPTGGTPGGDARTVILRSLKPRFTG